MKGADPPPIVGFLAATTVFPITGRSLGQFRSQSLTGGSCPTWTQTLYVGPKVGAQSSYCIHGLGVVRPLVGLQLPAATGR